MNRYSEGLKAYESGDKSGAFSTWADFMKEERGHYGGNTSYYSKQVNEKVVTEYMARAKRATESGDYHHAYGLWEKAAKIDETGVVQDELNPSAPRDYELTMKGYDWRGLISIML